MTWRMRLTEPTEIRLLPPVNGMVHVTVTVGNEQIIVAELAIDVTHATITEWLRVLLAQR